MLTLFIAATEETERERERERERESMLMTLRKGLVKHSWHFFILLSSLFIVECGMV